MQSLILSAWPLSFFISSLSCIPHPLLSLLFFCTSYISGSTHKVHPLSEYQKTSYMDKPSPGTLSEYQETSYICTQTSLPLAPLS